MVVHLSPVASAGAGGTNRHLYLGTDGIQEASAHITGDKQDTERNTFLHNYYPGEQFILVSRRNCESKKGDKYIIIFT